MQKKAWNRGLTARFCEPWPVHTVPMFQALNGTVGLSFQFFFSYTALFGLMGMRVPHIETLKPSNLNHSLISHLCLSLTAHSHLSSLPLSLVAISHHSLLTQSLSQSLFASFSLCLVAIGHHKLPRLQLAHLITLCLSPTLPCRHQPPRAAQIVAHSLNHSLPLSHPASSPSLQVPFFAILQL